MARQLSIVYHKSNFLFNSLVVILASGLAFQLAMAQAPGKNPTKVNKGKQTGELKSMGAMLAEQEGRDTKTVPEPAPLGPMGLGAKPNSQASQQAGASESSPTLSNTMSEIVEPRLPTLDEIIANARFNPKPKTIQDLIAYRMQQSGIIYEPRTRFLPIAIDRDQQWINAFLTYSEHGNEQSQNQFHYDELLAMRRVRMRDWFQTRMGERVSGVASSEKMKELSARIDEFSKQIWNAGTGLQETIDDWNEIQFEKSDTDAVSIALATDDTKSAFQPNWRLLAHALPADSVYIDIVRFRRMDVKDWQYSAFLVSRVKRDTVAENDIIQVARIDLGSADKIDTAVSRWRSTIKRGENDLAAGKRVFDLLWAPLQSTFRTPPNAIFVCADGDVASIPFAALPINDKHRLMDVTSVSLVPFAGHLVHERLPLPARYMNRPGHPENDLLIVCPDEGPAYAKSETEAIFKIATSKSLETELLIGERVRSQTVRDQLQKSRVAHFSSHGILATQALSRNRQAELLPKNGSANPLDLMLFSAIMLKNDPALPMSDRVFTAEHFSRLDCRSLKLVVLAACDTGKGMEVPNEGVLSLVTGLHIAGADNVLGTYWRVDDKASSQIMKVFYEHLLSGVSPRSALRIAQRTARDSGYRTHEWAGFLLSGAGDLPVLP